MTTIELSEFRYHMMERGYMNKKELSKFLEMGRNQTEKVWNSILDDIEKEGVEKIDMYVLTKRAIAYVGLTEKKIVEAYERSQKKKELI